MNHDDTNVRVTLVPEKAALVEGQANKLNVLAKIQVADKPESDKQQVPINMAIVIDASGSMSGHPLREAKKAAISIVQKLRPIDKVAVVAFGTDIELVQPITEAGNSHLIESRIEAIRTRGMTNLHGGWLQGVGELAKVHKQGELSRVLVLSDGCANEGELRHERIAEQCKSMASTGITTSTCGLGEHFEEEFLNLIADAGQGRAYYGELADDLQDAFDEELSILQYTYADSVRLNIETAQGVGVELLNPYKQTGTNAWVLPNLNWGAETWAMLQLTTPRIDELNLSQLVAASVRYSQADSGELLALEHSLTLPAVSQETYDDMKADETVQQRSKELQVAQLNLKARALADTGDWSGIDQILDEAQLQHGDHEWLAESIGELQILAKRRNHQQFSKEAYYAANSLATRHAMAHEDLDDYSIEAESEKAAFLRRKKARGKRLG